MKNIKALLESDKSPKEILNSINEASNRFILRMDGLVNTKDAKKFKEIGKAIVKDLSDSEGLDSDEAKEYLIHLVNRL